MKALPLWQTTFQSVLALDPLVKPDNPIAPQGQPGASVSRISAEKQESAAPGAKTAGAAMPPAGTERAVVANGRVLKLKSRQDVLDLVGELKAQLKLARRTGGTYGVYRKVDGLTVLAIEIAVPVDSAGQADK